MSEIPHLSRTLVQVRDMRMCVRCGHKGADWHHRRTRSVVDRHRHCPCNGVLLCRTCHSWAHHYPTQAKKVGLVVSRHCEAPFLIPVSTITGWWVNRCDGRSVYVPDGMVHLDEGIPWTPVDTGG